MKKAVKSQAPSANTSPEHKGYNEANPAQPHGANTPDSKQGPTETERTAGRKQKPVVAEKKLHGNH